MAIRTPNYSACAPTARSGSSGVRTCPSASGARCARTTAHTATPGTTSRTTTHVRAPTAGARTASPASPMPSSACASRWRCGTASDPILKERLFGLTNSEGNHGEDVKELYYYLDATPTHSYLKMLYKYPQAAFPYADLVNENRRRGIAGAEYELHRYRLVRRRPLLRRRGRIRPGVARRHATRGSPSTTAAPRPRRSMSCRRSCSATPGAGRTAATKPAMRSCTTRPSRSSIRRSGASISTCDDAVAAAGHRGTLFCENETNTRRLWDDEARDGYFKDGINDHVVAGDAGAVNPAGSRHEGRRLVRAHGSRPRTD